MKRLWDNLALLSGGDFFKWFLPFSAVGLVWVLRSLEDPWLAVLIPYESLLLLIIASIALVTGLKLGAAAAVLSTLAVKVFLLEPGYTLRLNNREEITSLFLFFINALLVSAIGAKGRDALRQAAEALQSQKTIFDHAGVGIGEVSGDDRLIAVNDRLCEIVRRSKSELLDMNVNELTWPEDRTLTQKINRQIHKGEKDRVEYEKRYIRGDGSMIWVSVTVCAVRDSRGTWQRSIATVQDISERKAAEARVHLQAAALEASPSAISISSNDPEGTIVWVNSAFVRLTGYEAKEAAGNSLMAVGTGQETAGFQETLKEITTTGGTWRGELTSRRKDGTLFQEEAEITPVKGEGGAITHYLAVRQDITARKQAETALFESEQRFRKTYENASVGITITDAQSRWTLVNQKICDLMNMPRNELIGMSFFDVTHPEDAGAELEKYQALWRGDIGSYRMEKRYVRKDGSIIWLEIERTLQRDQEGRPAYSINIIQEITARKLAEERLLASEALLRQVLETSPFPVIVHREDGKVIAVNAAFTRLSGYRLEDIPTIEAWTEKAYGSEKREDMPRYIKQLYQGLKEMTPQGEYEVRTVRGEIRTWDFFSGPLGRDRDGSRRLFTTTADVTERKLAEQKLRDSERSFRELADSMPQIVWTALPDGSTDYFNRKWYELTGAREGVVDTESWLSVMHPDDRRRCLKVWYEAVRTGNPYEAEYRFKLLAQSDYRWHIGRALPVKDQGGKIIRWYGTSTDIHEFREARELLKLQGAALEETSAAIIICDREGKIQWANPAVEKLTGYSSDEIVGKSPRIFNSGEHPAEFYAGLWSTILSGRVWHGEMINRRKDGSTYVEDLNITPVSIQEEKDITHFIAIKTDISDRKKAEKERFELMQQAQRAQRLESIGTLAGGIAHDFNNLLAGLFGYIELGRMYAEGKAGDKTLPTLDKALSVIEQAKGLTQQLLTFSKGGTPMMKVENIAKPLKEAAAFALSGSNVEARFWLQDNLWPCRIDANQMRQAIDNILINAKEAMPSGGTVSITAENIGNQKLLPKALGPGNYLKITIADQGYGIRPEALEHIFDPFFTTKETGHGLGLAVAYSIVKKHGGTIEVESEVNKGTTFNIYLPASSQQAPASIVEERAEPRRTRRQARILVMDDEYVIQEVVAAMLRGLGCTVACASNGEEAIRMYKEAYGSPQPFDAAILDLTVRTGLGGKETMQRLLEINPSVKALVSSGYSNDPVMADPTHYGFKGALSKPYQSKDLDEALNRLFADEGFRWLVAV